MHDGVVFTGVPVLMLTEVSASIEQIFTIIYRSSDGSFKGRCSGNRFVARVCEN